MKIGKKVFPKINKNKFKYEVSEVDEYINDEVPDAYLHFDIKNKIVTINLDWKEDFDLDEFVSLLLLMANGLIIQPIFEDLSGTRNADEVEYIKLALMEKIKEYKAEAEGEAEEDPPAISPLEVFDHLININSNGE